MLRDDDDTVALVAVLIAQRGSRQLDTIGHDCSRRHPSVPSGFPTVDELHAVTLRAWATFHEGDVLVPMPIEPYAEDSVVTHYLGLYARETRSTKTGQEMPCAHGRETDS